MLKSSNQRQSTKLITNLNKKIDFKQKVLKRLINQVKLRIKKINKSKKNN